MEYEMRPVTAEEFAAFAWTAEAAFGQHVAPEDIESWRGMADLGRTLAVFDAGQIVATGLRMPFELTLPGLTRLAVSGVAAVGVLPTHRRQGLLRALMRRQLGEMRERGETAAILTASESVIYGRFGYGMAASMMNVEIEKRHAAFARQQAPGGRVRLIEAEGALKVLQPLYDRVRKGQPGALNRTPERWREMLRATPRDGAGALFYATYTSDAGQVDGAVLYRVRPNWHEGIASHTLLIERLIAATDQAQRALWQYCFGVDLVQTVRATGRPVDEPLRWMLADPRRLRVTALLDDLWLRLLDVPAALRSRRYAAAGRLVLDVVDAFQPEADGRYALEGGPDGAECGATTAEPDLVLEVSDLGAAYLGGVRFGTLARAGRVEERTAGALARADALFACALAPWCATPF